LVDFNTLRLFDHLVVAFFLGHPVCLINYDFVVQVVFHTISLVSALYCFTVVTFCLASCA